MERDFLERYFIKEDNDKLPIFYHFIYTNKMVPLWIEKKNIYISKFYNSQVGAMPSGYPISKIILTANGTSKK
jgi:hypothetical protein